VNRGVAAAGDAEQILVTNPDVTFHAGAVAALSTYLATHETTAIVGPRIERPDGTSYPSQRIFPNMWLAGAHALLAPLWPANPATKRYRATHRDGSVDWVSGAAFLIRRDAFDAVGGFDERYFMFAEDMKLCWDLRQQGWLVAGDNDAVITHVEGVSRARVSRKMAVAHTTSALRFEWHTARGLRRWFVPLAAIVLLLRLGVVLVVPSRKG
jgi:N-acetylglucosaminyl-diphospho-decaprenol L-rhamnosyltransferase